MEAYPPDRRALGNKVGARKLNPENEANVVRATFDTTRLKWRMPYNSDKLIAEAASTPKDISHWSLHKVEEGLRLWLWLAPNLTSDATPRRLRPLPMPSSSHSIVATVSRLNFISICSARPNISTHSTLFCCWVSAFDLSVPRRLGWSPSSTI